MIFHKNYGILKLVKVLKIDDIIYMSLSRV